MTDCSDRQHDAFDNPAKALCRAGNLRVLREAAYRPRGRLVIIQRGYVDPESNLRQARV
jgi:hypothetical protein